MKLTEEQDELLERGSLLVALLILILLLAYLWPGLEALWGTLKAVYYLGEAVS